MYVAMITLNVHTKCRYKHSFYAYVLVNLIHTKVYSFNS